MYQDTAIDWRWDIISRKNNKSEIISENIKEGLTLRRGKSWSPELLCKQERYARRLLMGAVHNMRFIALSARLSAIDDAMVDGPSKSRGCLWESRVGMAMFRTVSDAGKTLKVSHETLDEK